MLLSLLHSNENLILDSVALLFITDIDNIAYKFRITDVFKNSVEGLPNIGKFPACTEQKHKALTCFSLVQYLGPLLSLVVLFGATSVNFQVKCEKWV